MTKSELKSIIMECLEENNIIQEAEEEIVYEESVLCEAEKTIFISKQGQDIKEEIKTKVYEYTSRAGFGDNIKELFTGGRANVINTAQVQKCSAEIAKLFDVVHTEKPERNGSGSSCKVKFIAVKGKYLYRFDILFDSHKSQFMRLSFNETIIDAKNFVTPKAHDIISFAIKNCQPDYFLSITKRCIRSGKNTGFFSGEPNYGNNKLYDALVKKFPNDCIFDDTGVQVRFKFGSQI